MGRQFKELSSSQIEFIPQQNLFFVGTAAEEGRVNISKWAEKKAKMVSKSIGKRRTKEAWMDMTPICINYQILRCNKTFHRPHRG